MISDLLEKLAAAEHEQWIFWSKVFYQKHKNNPKLKSQFAKWEMLWNTPYDQLTEEQKEEDRIWARKVLNILITDLRAKL